MHFICYRGNRQITSFIVSGRQLATEDRLLFLYPMDLEIMGLIDAPEVHPFRLRRTCASNLYIIYSRSHLFEKNASTYPEPSAWSDIVVSGFQSQHSIENGITGQRFSDPWTFNRFRCPGGDKHANVTSLSKEPHRVVASEQSVTSPQSDYAMNPNCGPNSPADTVLLFETKPGWNQHGGPELFTFDNHEPKGGCVLLNDGSVKFIRTEEELKQLRWR
jgi:hypothetical protein